jgi:hypothetical protein
MLRFLVTFHPGRMPQDAQAVADARQAIARWANHAGHALDDLGSPVRSALVISRDGIHAEHAAQTLLGWSVVQATDAADAAWLLRDHPLVQRGCLAQIHEPV